MESAETEDGMRGIRGFTLAELLVVLAISAILCAVVVPGAVMARRSVATEAAAHRLALVLRAAQAHAEASGRAVRVTVSPAGEYALRPADASAAGVMSEGELGAAVDGTWPGGALEFAAAGWPTLPGGGSPRAGHFDVGDGLVSRAVTVQLGGCVRCE
jgi:type II secretion system protein H